MDRSAYGSGFGWQYGVDNIPDFEAMLNEPEASRAGRGPSNFANVECDFESFFDREFNPRGDRTLNFQYGMDIEPCWDRNLDLRYGMDAQLYWNRDLDPRSERDSLRGVNRHDFGPGYDRGSLRFTSGPLPIDDRIFNSFIDEKAYLHNDNWPVGMLDENEFLGTQPGINYGSQLRGNYRDAETYMRRRSLLTEPIAGGIVPTARTTMPKMWLHPSGRRVEIERTWSGHNDSMPQGAVDYVGVDEPWTWGPGCEKTTYPAEIVDYDFVRSREMDPDWSPPGPLR